MNEKEYGNSWQDEKKHLGTWKTLEVDTVCFQKVLFHSGLLRLLSPVTISSGLATVHRITWKRNLEGK